MKATKRFFRSAGVRTSCVLSLAMALPAAADYDVLAVVENVNVERFTVSDDGDTWTKAETPFMATSPTVCQMTAIGDGYIYAAVGSAIKRYRLDGTEVDTWAAKIGNVAFADKTRLVASPDRVWFYLGGNWNEAKNVARCRISDPSIGGFLGLQNESHGNVNWLKNRHLVVSRDGLLYFGARGNPGDAADPTRGVFVYDPTLRNVPRAGRYTLPGGNNGAGVLVDEDRLYVVFGEQCNVYGRGVSQSFSSVKSGFSNPFFGVDLGPGGAFFGDWGLTCVWKRNPTRIAFSKIDVGIKNIIALSDVTAARTTDSKLPWINGVWYMNEAADAESIVNGAEPGIWDMTPSGDLRAGCRGAVRGGLFSRDGGYGVITASTQIVPQTGDFTIGLWVYAPSGTARTLLSNAAATLSVGPDGKPRFAAGGVTVTGTDSIWDGWHGLTVRRNGGMLELWVDNVKSAEQALDPTAGIDQTVSWTLGADYDGGNAAGPVFFDELRIYPVLLTEEDMTLLHELVQPTALPPPGSEISSVSLGDVCYTAFNGKVYATTDGGANWTAKGTVGLDAVSLFTADGALYAAGRNAAGMLALATASDGGGTWNVVRVGDGLRVPTLVATQPVLAGGRVWLGAPSRGKVNPALVSFAFTNGTASDPTLASAVVPFHKPSNEPTIQQAHKWVTGVTAVAATNGTVYAVGTSAPRFTSYGECVVLATNETALSLNYSGTLGFPGGSKPLSIVWDGVTRRHWAVTAACPTGSRSADVSPVNEATSLALYSTDDLYNWRYHRSVTVTGCPFYRRPSAAIVGEDLVVSFLDGEYATTFRSTVFGGFRAFWTGLSKKKQGFHAQELFLPEEDDGWVVKYYHEEATGDWIPAGLFCRNGVYGGKKLQQPINVRSFGDSVFVSTMDKDHGIYEFTKYGAFVRHYETPFGNDAFCVSLDGTKLYTTKWWGSVLCTIDRATGAVTTKDFGNVLAVSRGVADLGNGKVAITSRGTSTFIVYDTQTDSYVSYGKEDFPGVWAQNPTSTDGPMDLFYDAASRRLWMYGKVCGLGYFDTETASFTKAVGTMYGHGIALWNDSILLSVYTPSRVVRFSPDADGVWHLENVALISCGRKLNRLAVVDMPQIETGTLCVFR